MSYPVGLLVFLTLAGYCGGSQNNPNFADLDVFLPACRENLLQCTRWFIGI